MQNRRLSAVYVVTALVALLLTWSQNLAYFGPSAAGPLAAFPLFLTDAAINPAARSIAFDILLMLYAASLWMVFEGRRRRMRFVWAYVVLGLMVAISVTFPLFLAAREMKATAAPDIEGRPSLLDGVGIGLLTAVVGALCLFVLKQA
ncbi:MAG TPA: DUF2834 domain-containing protein [Phenylobacterium sp.]|nr:DUF2834 domain-containing protein [Phenylobacterium sp.]